MLGGLNLKATDICCVCSAELTHRKASSMRHKVANTLTHSLPAIQKLLITCHPLLHRAPGFNGEAGILNKPKKK